MRMAEKNEDDGWVVFWVCILSDCSHFFWCLLAVLADMQIDFSEPDVTSLFSFYEQATDTINYRRCDDRAGALC